MQSKDMCCSLYHDPINIFEHDSVLLLTIKPLECQIQLCYGTLRQVLLENQ